MKRVGRSLVLLLLAWGALMALRAAVYLPMVCERRVTGALSVLGDSADGDAIARHIAAESAHAMLAGCGSFECGDFQLAYARGLADAFAGDPFGAIAAYRSALSIDRRPEIYIDLGRAQLDAHDRRAAMKSFATAGTFSPAILERIPDDSLRQEVVREINETHGGNWIQ